MKFDRNIAVRAQVEVSFMTEIEQAEGERVYVAEIKDVPATSWLPERYVGGEAAAKGGDSWAFERLFTEIQAPLRAFAVARGADDPDGLVNEVLAQVFAAIPTFTGDETGFRGLVFHVARRRLIDGYRRTKRRPALDLRPTVDERPRGSAGDDTSPVSSSLEHTLRVLDTLTTDQRDVLILRVVCDLSIAETAEALDKPITAIKALQRRGLAALKRKISDGTVSL